MTTVFNERDGTGVFFFPCGRGVRPFTYSHWIGPRSTGVGGIGKVDMSQPLGRLLYGLSSGRGSSSSIGETQTTTARCVGWRGEGAGGVPEEEGEKGIIGKVNVRNLALEAT
jgi:hypothetical protein